MVTFVFAPRISPDLPGIRRQISSAQTLDDLDAEALGGPGTELAFDGGIALRARR
jgi:hypothetical protein